MGRHFSSSVQNPACFKFYSPAAPAITVSINQFQTRPDVTHEYKAWNLATEKQLYEESIEEIQGKFQPDSIPIQLLKAVTWMSKSRWN